MKVLPAVGLIQAGECETERNYDKLNINGVNYHGSANYKPRPTVPTGDIYWSTDGSLVRKGWKLCVMQTTTVSTWTTTTTLTTISFTTSTTTTLLATNQILFVGNGDDTTHTNRWTGWFNRGSTVIAGRGKRAAYDDMRLTSLRFSDSSGAWAEYELIDSYCGRSLLSIVKACLRANRSNDGGSVWQHGHCSIGVLRSSRGIASVARWLRIGVGDGSADDPLDWALFMLQTGNAGGDFKGTGAYALGSEIFTNTGHAGEVTLYGGVGTSTTMTTSASTTTTTTLPANYRILLIGTGANITHRNQWAGWFNNGSTVTEGRGKRAAYDGMPVTSLRFSDSSGAWAEYDLTAPYSGRSLLTIVQDCMGADRFNDGGWKWQHGHCSVGILKSSRDIASAATQLRIGVGDGSVDNTLDWGLFMLQNGNAGGDFQGTRAYALGSERITNTGHAGEVMLHGGFGTSTYTTTSSTTSVSKTRTVSTDSSTLTSTTMTTITLSNTNTATPTATATSSTQTTSTATRSTHTATVTTTISTTRTTEVTWRVVEGACKMDSTGCASSPHFPSGYREDEYCKILVPQGMGVIEAVQFKTERNYDKLIINGEEYHGSEDNKPPPTLATGEIIWVSDYWRTEKGWKLCPQTPAPTPVPTPAPAPTWRVVRGACRLDYYSGCVSSPRFPSNYMSSDKCIIRVDSSGGLIQAVEFETERNYDRLNINGVNYHGSANYKPRPTVPTGDIYWSTDRSVVRKGWKLCPMQDSEH